MKKSLIAVVGAMLATAACADYIISFETNGNDQYGDGQTVIDGEKYALVWTPSGTNFAGFAANGEAIAPSVCAFKAALAAGGKCPLTLIAVTDDAMASITNGTEGTWGIYLLDTRIWPADDEGKLTGVQPSQVGSVTVKNYGEVNGNANVSFVKDSATTVATLVKNADLKITSLTVDDENVTLKVVGAGKFSMVTGDTPTNIVTDVADSVRASEDPEKEMTITYPKDGTKTSEFFKVK